ncbi:MAG: hypothetical protein DRJ35_01665 [Thermoprotei archaeon]|nr:MAG: hypothetical protein DRJ35_01665 [Thermoprotei archaeon]
MKDSHRVYFLAVSSFFYMTGIGASLAVFPLAIRSVGGSDLEVSVTIGIWALVYLLANIPAGLVSDKLGPSVTVPLSFILNVPLGLLFYFGKSTPFYLAGRALEGILEALIWTGIFGFTAKKFSGLKLKSFGLLYGAMSLGFSIGPSLSVYVSTVFGIYSPFLILSAVSILASIFSALSFKGIDKFKLSEKERLPIDKLLAAIKEPVVIAYVLIAYIIGTFESTFVSFSPELVVSIGFASTMAGLLLTLYYSSGLVGQFSLNFIDKIVDKRAFPITSYILALTVFTLTLISSNTVFLVLFIALAGFFNGLNTSRLQSKLSSRLRELESTAIGLGNTGWAIGYSGGATVYTLLFRNEMTVSLWIGLLTGILALVSLYVALAEQ